jgi:Ca2+-binding EF-hand superfamily protein
MSNVLHIENVLYVDSAKLNWAFKLYDVDNDGMIDLHEMSVIMETLDRIEGIKPGLFSQRSVCPAC